MKVCLQKLLKTNVEKMSLLGLVEKSMKTSQLKISSKYVDDNNDTYEIAGAGSKMGRSAHICVAQTPSSCPMGMSVISWLPSYKEAL